MMIHTNETLCVTIGAHILNAVEVVLKLTFSA